MISDSPESRSMRKRWMLRLLFVLCFLAMVAVAVLWLYEPASSFPPIPEPNGYVALTRAAAKLPPPPDDLKTLSTELLAEEVAKNSNTVYEVRQALQMRG